MKISAVILSSNDKTDISRCLKSVDFCEEKVILRGVITDFSKQRNDAMQRVKNEWMLFIDTDEQITKELKLEIQNLKFEKSAYYIKRRDFWWGRELKYGETKKLRNNGIIRLVKKGSGYWQGKVHEVFVTDKPTARLSTYLNHYPHPTLKEFIKSINEYSTLRAKELKLRNVKTNILQIIFYPLGKFILNYFFNLGFLDGPAGFAYCFMMSFHSFLVRAKLYQYD